MAAYVAGLLPIEIAIRAVRIVCIGARVASGTTSLVFLVPHLIEASFDATGTGAEAFVLT